MPGPDRRKYIPLKAQLHAALFQLGFEPTEVQLDHSPALVLRGWDDTAQDTVPAASDPRFLIWRPTAEHKIKTFGPGGAKRVTSAGGDLHAAAHTRRLTEKQAKYQARLLAKTAGEPEPPPSKRKRPWPSRPFPKRHRSKP